MSADIFLNGRVQLCCGDSLHFMRDQPEARYDSVVTDPPYALVSMTKARPDLVNASNPYARKQATAGFMGKKWDTGETAFAVEFWQQVLRVLKPGGHVVAFSGTRTYHRLACAIEDAGFEIRDMVQWLYGSGFPKSHDVSKGIDKRGGNSHLTREIGEAIKSARESRGMSAKECDKLFCGGTTNWSWFEGRPVGQRAPTAETFAAICAVWPELLPLMDAVAEVEREVIGQQAATLLAVAPGQGNNRSATTLDVTLPGSAAAQEWQGWGTALKPACEPICLARKPLSEGTVAANVLRWRTGALNIGASRIGNGDDRTPGGNPSRANFEPGWGMASTERATGGRWPANVVHDGSDEVIAAFPSGGGGAFSQSGIRETRDNPIYGKPNTTRNAPDNYGDEGSAARFFYSAKADSMDRLGSRHPTVKPVDLMQWLVRLITPKGGLVLDPFAGTGTTAEACYREGMRCALVERETEYQVDIRRRMALVLGGPDERRRESIKAKNFPVDHGPLFAEAT